MKGDILSMGADRFQPKPVEYVDVLKLLDLYEGLAFRAPTIVCGPKGIGKTLSVQHFAYEAKSPIITFDCSEDVRRSQLLGMHVLRGNHTPFVLGPVTNAFAVANEVGRCILCLEECNALSPQSQKILNAVADWRQRVEVPEAQEVFELKGGSQLWVTGTMNTAVYGGVYTLNEDLKSRFRLLAADYPKPSDEMAIISKVVTNGVREPVIRQVLTLANETRQDTIDYSLSTRDIVQLIEDIGILDLPRALRIVLGKFEGNDRATVVERVKSIFQVDLGAFAG